MAIHFKLVRSNVKRNNSCGKYFAKAVSQGEVTLNELAEEAAANSGITKAAFKRALTELQDLMKERPASHRVNTGSGTKNGHIVYDLCDGVKAVWHKGFKP